MLQYSQLYLVVVTSCHFLTSRSSSSGRLASASPSLLASRSPPKPDSEHRRSCVMPVVTRSANSSCAMNAFFDISGTCYCLRPFVTYEILQIGQCLVHSRTSVLSTQWSKLSRRKGENDSNPSAVLMNTWCACTFTVQEAALVRQQTSVRKPPRLLVEAHRRHQSSIVILNLDR